MRITTAWKCDKMCQIGIALGLYRFRQRCLQTDRERFITEQRGVYRCFLVYMVKGVWNSIRAVVSLPEGAFWINTVILIESPIPICELWLWSVESFIRIIHPNLNEQPSPENIWQRWKRRQPGEISGNAWLGNEHIFRNLSCQQNRASTTLWSA